MPTDQPAVSPVLCLRPSQSGGSKDKARTARRPSSYAWMPKVSRCLSAPKLLDCISQRRQSQVDMKELVRYKNWIQNQIKPNLDRQGGHGVSSSDMEQLLVWFASFVFWNNLKKVKFVWVPGMLQWPGAFATTDNAGRTIRMDPSPHRRTVRYEPHEFPDSSRGDQILSVLLHEACHAFLAQYVCGNIMGIYCGRKRCFALWEEQVEFRCGHGPAFVRLAKGAEQLVNRYGLWKCRTGHQMYVGPNAQPR